MGAVFLHCLNYVMLPTNNCLDKYIINSGPQEAHINPYLLKMLTERTQTPLETEVVLFTVFILDKVIILLIDRVICQMHIFIVLIYFTRIGFTCKPCQTFLEYVNSHRLVTGNQYVDSEIEFMTID
jgi:hypothetical protein